ncbi:MAG: ATP-binding cassette domain-containing protein [Thermoanaerobaculia bacterium]
MSEAVLASLAWPEAAAVAALEALARRTGLLTGEARLPARLGPLGDRLERAGALLGLELEPVEVAGGELASSLLASGPALLHLPGHGLLAILRSRGRRLLVLGPDQRTHTLALPAVLALLLARPAEDDPVKRLLLQERLRRSRVGGLWLLRPPPGGGFWRQARQAGLHRHLLTFIVVYAVSYSLLLGSWWALGVGVLQGRLVRDALIAWGLILLSLIPFRMISVWSRARLAIGAGALLKRRLLAGALKLQPEEIRHQGSGQLLGRVIESEAVETLALNGGFLAVVGLIETALSAGVLAAGAGGGRHALLLAGWLAVTLALARWFFGRRREWTRERLDMTHTLVEGLVGHRTRLVQEDRRRWHAEEDRRVDAYLQSSRIFDRSKAVLLAVGPRGWLIVGLAGLLPAFLGGAASPGLLALGVGGVLSAYRGFQKISEGFSHLSGAILSWGYATELFRAASRPESEGVGASRPEEGADGRPLLEALDLSFRHAGRGRPVLDGCSLKVARGDRILLEGPSGGGKSTLAALLTGLREPASGLVLLDGLDRRTIGDPDWRRRVVLAPQFHENHVFTETFAFNLLMGRGWPPSPEDMAEAVEVCRELGLGKLLDRMPSGLQQIVGETGWQLSHGERSRLYMARALLQGAEVVILDESFAALDPENLHQALDCALKRARTLVVIAHP